MDFDWAKDYPEIQKICNLFSLTELSAPQKFAYKPLQGFMQEGPQCGLVALAMYLGSPNKQQIDSLLLRAQQEQYSHHGEMFSAANMANLAKLELKTPTQIELHSGPLNCDKIKHDLLNGACVLVPYDTEKDNSPGLLNGTKAHWAIVSGAIQTDGDFYVLARHGKAKNVAIWRLADLSASNMQLNVVGTYQKQPDVKFKIPEGGIDGPLGLKSKSIILKSL